MGPLSVPKGGLTLTHELPSKVPSLPSANAQIIRLDMVHDKTKDILKSLRNNEKVRVQFGKKASIQFGKESIALSHEATAFQSELYSRLDDSMKIMYFSGKLNHVLEVRKAQKAIANADQALAALESSLKSIQEQKASNVTSFVRNKEEMSALNKKASHLHPLHSSALKRDHLFNGVTRSTPSSPFLGASFSPRMGPTSAPMPTAGISEKDKIRLNAIRIPLVHILAIAPATTKSLAHALHASVEDCERVLQKVARDSTKAAGKKELKEKSFRELDVWKFPYKTQDDRQSAIDHTIHAFDRMRIDRADPLWQLLLSEGERGKGKYLSRLNFDKPVASHNTPKPERKSPEVDVVEEGGANQDPMRPEPTGRAKGRARSTEPLQRKKVSEKETLSKQQVRKDAINQLRDIHHDKPKGEKERVSKREGKYKSSEFILDSDEEAEAASNCVAKPSLAGRNLKEYPSPKAPSLAHPKKTLHKSNLSSSSTDSKSAEDKTSDRLDSNRLKSRPQAESSLSRISPRPRTDSSPLKPSPLSSSPPTNSTDLDNSDKTSSRSSVTSSPPSSTDMPDSKPHKFSPKVSRQERGRSPAKRMADSNAIEQPPAKRQQVNGVHLNSHTPDLIDGTQRPSVQRQSSDSSSGSSLSPGKPEQCIEEVVDKSKRFQLYYKRYKDLHEKVANNPEEDEQETHELWKMHNRLKELKDEIWSDWRKLGEPKEVVM